MDYRIRFQMILPVDLARAGDDGGDSDSDPNSENDADAEASGVNSGGGIGPDRSGGYSDPESGQWGGGNDSGGSYGYSDRWGRNPDDPGYGQYPGRNQGYYGENPDSTAFGGAGTPSEQQSARDAAGGGNVEADPYSGENPDSTAHGGAGTPSEREAAKSLADSLSENEEGFSWDKAKKTFSATFSLVSTFLGPAAGLAAGAIAGGIGGLSGNKPDTGHLGHGADISPGSDRGLSAGSIAGMGGQQIEGSQLDSVSGRPDSNKGTDWWMIDPTQPASSQPAPPAAPTAPGTRPIPDILDELRSSFGLRDTILGRRLGRPNIRRRTLLGMAA